MAFLPFDEYQKTVNSEYYSLKGSRIYSDFSTFALGNGKLAIADAWGFYKFAGKTSGNLRVCEFGVGAGHFARAFLDELKRLDEEKKTTVASRVTYSLVDFSFKMLEDAKKNLAGYAIETVCSDALSFRPKEKFHCVRANELLSDLPSKLLFRKGKETFEIGFLGKDMASEEFLNAPKEVGVFPQGYAFPLNTGAIEFLKRLQSLLVSGGYADIFDYGFADFQEVEEEPRVVWNENVSRLYGEQVTVDINFAYLKSVFPKMKVEPQKEYAERALGKKLFQAQLEGQICYLNQGELKKMKGKLKAEGYSEDFIKGEFVEESDFWHARIEA